MAEQVDSTDCIHCDDGTAVRATDFKSGTVLEHYRCLACGKKFRPDEATGPMRNGVLDEEKPAKTIGSKRPPLSPEHKEKLRKARIETVSKKPKVEAPVSVEARCTKPSCKDEKAPGRAWCQRHVDQHRKYEKPKAEKAANVVVGELPPQPEMVTTTSAAKAAEFEWKPLQVDGPHILSGKHEDWKAPILAQLDAERMATYQRLDKVIAAIDAIKAL